MISGICQRLNYVTIFLKIWSDTSTESITTHVTGPHVVIHVTGPHVVIHVSWPHVVISLFTTL
jgi:hypothetical protein